MPWKDAEKRREYERQRYAANVEFVKQYKLEHGCADCGYNEHPAALEFDHVQPHLRGIVGKQMGKTLKIILEEIERCEVVCANCHNIRGCERGQHSQAANKPS
jgi:hypothetical protein